jgi:uncharacterized membrane-anchored protein
VTADVKIGEGDGGRLTAHALRAAVLGEVHARPFTPIKTPRRVLHFAFDTTGERGEADRAALIDFCTQRRLTPPKPYDKQHHVVFGSTGLRWEQHSEFTTYTWELPSGGFPADAVPFHPPATTIASPMGMLPQPGPLLVALDLHLVAKANTGTTPEKLSERLFDPASLAAAETGDGAALYATDFQYDPAGFIRILIIDQGLTPPRAGALVQRVLEIETYRTLALLGLPEAQRLGPSVARIERKLADFTEEMRKAEGFEANHRLLDELTALAAELEAGAAASLFRFGASRAYNGIVQLRLDTVGERAVTGFTTWSSFLARRMAPAMRTCIALEERQANLSTKLARAANLLRTRVDVELERQNSSLLQSMNRRTQLQLRLQATVEGLSVAAITYYVVGLFTYVIHGANEAGLRVNPTLATAAFVPIAALLIWWIVRRIRRRHVDKGTD